MMANLDLDLSVSHQTRCPTVILVDELSFLHPLSVSGKYLVVCSHFSPLCEVRGKHTSFTLTR